MTSELKARLTGVAGVLVAPYDDAGALETAGLEPIVDRAVNAGVHTLVANGNTGEFYSLGEAETGAMIEAAVAMADGRVPVLGGVGKGVREAEALAARSQAAGAAALLVHQPPVPFVAPRGTVDYVKRIAGAAAGLPLVFYLRDESLGLEALRELCAIPEIMAVKWATPNPMMLARVIREIGDEIVWVCGLAEAWAPIMAAAGARGFTSGLINIWPERSVAIHGRLAVGDFTGARELIEEIVAFEDLRAEEGNGTNVSVVKAALAILGEDCGPPRPPAAWPLTTAQGEKLRATLGAWGLAGR